MDDTDVNQDYQSSIEDLDKQVGDVKDQNVDKEGTLYSRLCKSLVTTLAEYGTLGIIFHQVFSILSLIICYCVVSCGFDVNGFLEYFDLMSTLPSGATSFVIAFVVHKTMTPLRIFVTINCVPFIARSLWYGRLKGWYRQWRGEATGGGSSEKEK